MSQIHFNLAIATAGGPGSLTLGCDDQILDTIEVPNPQRHNVDLLPTIDRLCQRHSVTPKQLSEIYLSIGPGSFTGLRIAVTTAKMFALSLQTKIVAVPTLDAVAQNAPPPVIAPENKSLPTSSIISGGNHQSSISMLAVCMNLKQTTVYTGLYQWDSTAQYWSLTQPPMLMTMGDLLARTSRPLMILGDPLPPLPDDLASSSDVKILPAEWSHNRSEIIWNIGRRMARENHFADPLTLIPLYTRPPEAQEIWDRRYGVGQQQPQ